MAEALLPRRTIDKQEYVLLADITVGTATTSVDITGLSIDKDSEYMLVGDFASAGNGYTYVYFNANYTNSNYYEQGIDVNGTSISASRNNFPYNNWGQSGNKNLFIMNIKLTNNGYIVAQSDVNFKYDNGSSMQLDKHAITSTFTASSITSIRISGQTNQIGAGSRFQLYKVGA